MKTTSRRNLASLHVLMIGMSAGIVTMGCNGRSAGVVKQYTVRQEIIHPENPPSSFIVRTNDSVVGIVCTNYDPRKNLTCTERGSGYPTSETIMVYVVATGELKNMYFNLSDG